MKFIFILPLVLLFSCHNQNLETRVEINLSTMGNDIAFDQNAIQVPLGKPVSLIFRNKADHDSQIDHNVALIKMGREEEVFKIINDENYDFDEKNDPFKNSDLLIGYTKILAPQKMAIINFIPDKPGYYTYICLMPGHGNILKMKGILKVK